MGAVLCKVVATMSTELHILVIVSSEPFVTTTTTAASFSWVSCTWEPYFTSMQPDHDKACWIQVEQKWYRYRRLGDVHETAVL